MSKIVITAPFRTAIGSFGGTISTIPAVELGAKVIEGIIVRSDIKVENIDEVYMGNVLQGGIGQNPARQSAIKAGIPIEKPATTINTVCGSGLHTVGMAFSSIMSGQADVVLAGGMESMSNAPYILKGARNGYRIGHNEVLDSMVLDGLTCPIHNIHMGITAENIAIEYGISREQQDEFSVYSQQKALEAREKGIFDSEIIPIEVKSRKDTKTFKTDEYIREDSNIEKLSKLRPAFKSDGTVTAANASGINDGAAGMLVLSEHKCNELKLEPWVYIKGYTTVGLNPEVMGMGPVYAIKKLLKQQNMSIDRIDIFELNEAFASQSIAVRRELNIPSEKINVNGGAIALGHPIGASGARILVTLLHEMKRSNKRYGIASLCIGSGMGIAMLVENINQ